MNPLIRQDLHNYGSQPEYHAMTTNLGGRPRLDEMEVDLEAKWRGEVIERLRKQVFVNGKPMSQTELANRIGVDQSTMSKVERGVSDIAGMNARSFTKVAQGLEITVSKLAQELRLEDKIDDQLPIIKISSDTPKSMDYVKYDLTSNYEPIEVKLSSDDYVFFDTQLISDLDMLLTARAVFRIDRRTSKGQADRGSPMLFGTKTRDIVIYAYHDVTKTKTTEIYTTISGEQKNLIDTSKLEYIGTVAKVVIHAPTNKRRGN
jgi:transcriptional regulator with XRE-family HTH domain